MFGGGVLNLILVLPSGERSITILEEKEVIEEVAIALGANPEAITVSFTDNVIGRGLTTKDCGIVDGSRLSVTIENYIRTAEEFRHVVEKIVEQNQGLGFNVEQLMGCVTFKDDKIFDINFYSKNIEILPESFGNIEVGGNLELNFNKLKILPESFGNIKVGGNLELDFNKLTILPESFGNIKVGGHLYLSDNQLRTLPESFENITVGNNLYLQSNMFNQELEIIKPRNVSGKLFK